MTDTTKLGPWVRRFLLEHLIDERNLARNTQRSYRDSLALLISFIATKVNKEVDRLIVGDITAEAVACPHAINDWRWSMRWRASSPNIVRNTLSGAAPSELSRSRRP